MASKFDGIFAEADTATAPDARPAGRTEKLTPPPVATTARAAPGRPGGKGKASNPDWDQTTVYLKRATKQAAKAALLNRDSEQDLSELLEQLLAGWVKRQQ